MLNLKEYRKVFQEAADEQGQLTRKSFKEAVKTLVKGAKPLKRGGGLPDELLAIIESEQEALKAPTKELEFFAEYCRVLRKAKKDVFIVDSVVSDVSLTHSTKLDDKSNRKVDSFQDALDVLLEDKTKTRQDILNFIDKQNFNFLSSVEEDGKHINYVVNVEYSLGTKDTVTAMVYGKRYLLNKYVLEQHFTAIEGGWIFKQDRRIKHINVRLRSGTSAPRITLNTALKLEPLFNEYGLAIVKDDGSNSKHSLVSLRDYYVASTSSIHSIDSWLASVLPDAGSIVKLCCSCGNISRSSNQLKYGKVTYQACERCVGLDGFRNMMREKNKDHFNDPILLHGIKVSELKDKRVYGVELEYNSSGQQNLLSSCIVEICDSHWAAKSDGSVSNGAEFVSIPTTLEEHRAGFQRISQSPIFSAFTLGGAGIHVHVNRKSLSELTIFKLIHFMGEKENKEFIDKMAGRAANSYCERKASRSDIAYHKGSKKVTCGSKYRAVNTGHDATIEFRIFASTKKESEFMQRLQFVDSLILFAERNNVKSMTYHDFVAWYVTQPDYHLKRWVELSSYMDSLNYISYKHYTKPKKEQETKACA